MDKKIVLVSHGELSHGMYHSLQMIIGKNDNLYHLKMMPGEHYSVVCDEVEKMAKENPETQFIVVADLLGGSVCNGCIPLIENENIKLVSGMNMGLVIELLFAPAPMSNQDIQEKIEACKDGIVLVSNEYINSQDQSDDDFFLR